ncbi:MAG: asparaginase [Candidatus Kapabacteria bacterium]|nr:asparaginase [Candidatus Kapabacteria bacterium]
MGVDADHGLQNYEACPYLRGSSRTLGNTVSAPAKSRIVIIFTGGTIASKLDSEWGGVVPSMSGGEILARIPGIRSVADIVVHEYGTFPGPHITIERMWEISRIVSQYANDPSVDGVVVTHGTDTLEETAYFLDCSVDTPKPIVVIGAMRNSSEPDWDGPRNLRDAVTVAAHPSAQGLGVLVCLGGVITAASETSKTDTQDLSTFVSFDFGPIGRISNGVVFFHRRPLHRESYRVGSLPSFVPLLKSYAGMDDTLIQACRQNECSGLVIEAFGVGNVTPPAYSALRSAASEGLPVVLVSRCPVGRVEHIYAYEGAGTHLHAAGIIFADYLNGQKARIKLICALGAGMDVAQIRASFEWADASGTGTPL